MLEESLSKEELMQEYENDRRLLIDRITSIVHDLVNIGDLKLTKRLIEDEFADDDIKVYIAGKLLKICTLEYINRYCSSKYNDWLDIKNDLRISHDCTTYCILGDICNNYLPCKFHELVNVMKDNGTWDKVKTRDLLDMKIDCYITKNLLSRDCICPILCKSCDEGYIEHDGCKSFCCSDIDFRKPSWRVTADEIESNCEDTVL